MKMMTCTKHQPLSVGAHHVIGWFAINIRKRLSVNMCYMVIWSVKSKSTSSHIKWLGPPSTSGEQEGKSYNYCEHRVDHYRSSLTYPLIVATAHWISISRLARFSTSLGRKIHSLPGSSRFASCIQDFRCDYVYFQ